MLKLRKGTSFALGTYMEPQYMLSRVVWSSSDETVATVDQDGNVTAVGSGTAYIQVQTPFELGPVHMDPGMDECMVVVL